MLTDQELGDLKAFQARVADLRQSGLAKAGPQKLDLTVSTNPARSGFSGFDEDQFRSFVQIIRQFTLKKDPTFFRRICNLIRKRCHRKELLPWEAHARKLWDEAMGRSPIGLKVGDKQINTEEALRLLVYGQISHTHRDEAAELARMLPSTREALRFIVQSSLKYLAHSVHVIDSIIYHWLDDPESEVPPYGAVE